jgi:hypothetical protein
MTLPDEVSFILLMVLVVLVVKNMSKETVSTIGNQKEKLRLTCEYDRS